MPRNSVGTYSLPQAPFSPNTIISSSAVNSDLSDIASALTTSVASTGVTPITTPLKNPTGTALLPGISFGAFPDMGFWVFTSGPTEALVVSTSGVSAVSINSGRTGTGQDGAQIFYSNGAIISPVGAVQDFAGASAPLGWLLCFGQSLLRTDYPELFFVIGTTYGAADGTHFSLPDCRGTITAGKDNMGGSTRGFITNAGSGIVGTTLGASGGAQNVAFAQANLPTGLTFTVSGITLNDPGHFHNAQVSSASQNNSNPGNAFPGVAAGPINIYNSTTNGAQFNAGFITTGTTGVTVATQGTAASGGSSTAINKMPPTIIFNKIIFAGRP